MFSPSDHTKPRQSKNRSSQFFLQKTKLEIDVPVVTSLLNTGILKQSVLAESASNQACPIKCCINPELEEQEFLLKIEKNQVEIHANCSHGLFYGLCEWAFLFKKFPGILPCLRIQDKPKILNRGYMLDVSRCKVPTMTALKKLIDQLCLLRYNHLQLYIEHTFAFKDHAQVWGDSSPLTPEEIRELDQYCSERFIELVPNLNSFGHFEKWLKHKDYQHLAESPNGFTSPFGDFRPVGSVLKPNQKSLNFINQLYKEYLPNFKSPVFNVGCDETFELGQGFSQKLVQKKGIHQVYFDHLLKIQKLVKKHQRQMMFWADILIESPEVIKKLPKDITALIWGYEADHPFQAQCVSLKKTQAQYWVCPGSSSWNSLIGRWDNAEKNIRLAFEQGIQHGAQGLLLTDWGDGGHHQPWPISIPALVYSAHLTWSGQPPSRKKLEQEINRIFFLSGKNFAKTLLSMGTVHKKLHSPIMNGNALHHLLFDTGKVNIPSVKKLETTLKFLELHLEALKKFDFLEAREMQLGLNMAMLGLQKHLSHLNAQPFPISLARKTIGEFEELWLSRNRIGGLYESSAKLRAALLLD